MTARILHILAFLLLWSFPALAAEVAVVQSERLAPFDAAVRGFEATAGVRSVERFVLSETGGVNIARAVRESRPRLVLAVGREALERVKEIRELPIIYAMVASPGRTGSNITGIEMNVPAERYLSLCKKELGAKRVGIIHNPARTGALVREAREAAERLGITLVIRTADDPREAVRDLAGLQGDIDALWLLPDPTVVTRDTVEAIAVFSRQNRIPVLAFAAKYLAQGAIAAFEVDATDMGRQAGRVAHRVLNGTPVASLQPEPPDRANLKVNHSVARNLGVTLNE